MATTPLRLGLIGAGRWGRNYIKTIATLDGVRLAELASGNPESISLVPDGCRISSDWRSILDARRIDGLIVATPPALHAGMARAAVEAGLPVLVEKPLCMDLQEAIALRELVVARKGFVMVGHTHLFHPAFRKLKTLAPRYGAIRAIFGEAGNHGPFRVDTSVLWDWGSHDVAMCLDLLGTSPDHVAACRTESRMVAEGFGEVVDLELHFPENVKALIRVGNILPKKRRFKVEMETATLVYDGLASDPLTLYRKPAFEFPEEVSIGPEMPLTRLLLDFTSAISQGRPDGTSLDLGVSVVEVLQRCAAEMRG